ncbi:hypothetical protein HDU93_002614 [Gonapodya sp. JEL0774]|nr:hypothetical protein HDU93_002614 [Gonapodya sp. JEL0774]
MSVWVAVLFIGVPWWWKTTMVYRAALPFDDITSLANPGRLDVSFVVNVTLHVPVDSSRPSSDREALALRVGDAATELMRQKSLSDIPLIYTTGSVPPPNTNMLFHIQVLEKHPVMRGTESMSVNGLLLREVL